MADEKKTEEPKTGDGKTGEDAKFSVGTLRQLVREEFANLAKSLPGGGGDKPKEGEKVPDPVGSVADQVRAEIAKLTAKEKAAQRDKSIDDDIAALKEAAKPKVPVQRGRFHKLMGWGDPAE